MVQPAGLFVILEKSSMSEVVANTTPSYEIIWTQQLGFPPEFRVTVSIMEKVSKIQNYETISTTIFSRKPEISRTL